MFRNAQRIEAQEEAKRQEAKQEALNQQQTSLEYLIGLTNDYHKLSGRNDLSVAESQHLEKVVGELANVYGVVAEESGNAAIAQQNYNDKLEEAYQRKLTMLLVTQKQATAESEFAIDRKKAADAVADLVQSTEDYNEAWKQLNTGAYEENGIDKDKAQERVKHSWDNWQADLKALEQYKTAYLTFFNDLLNQKTTAAMLDGKKVNTVMLEQLRGMFDLDLSSFADQFQDDREVVDKYISDMSDSIISACTSPAVSEAITAAQDMMHSIYAGAEITSQDVDALKGAWSDLFGKDGALVPLVNDLATATGEPAHQIAENLMYALTGFRGLADGADMLTASTDTVKGALGDLQTEAAATGEAFRDMAEGFDWASASSENATKQAKSLLDRYDTLTDTLQRCERESKILEKGQAALNKVKKEGGKLSAQEERDLKAASKLVGYQGDRYDELGVHIKAYGKGLESTINASVSELGWLGGELENAAYSSNIDGQVRVDCDAAASNIQGLISIANAALTVLQMLGIVKAGGGAAASAPKRGGGGGGGGGKRNDEEEARRAAEEAERRRREAIEADYARIDHKRHLNQITLEEELAMLDQLRARHRLNAEEIMDWEERVYDLKQELRERDADSLDNLSDGVLTALEARYEAMLDAERQRLEQSRQAWEDWRDQSVKAIEDQIAALDELADTEDREKKDQEELRKIAKLRQQIAFEQDDYNRAKLEQQLAQALESREERLRKLALEDQKEALRAEIDQIEQKADDQIAALDREEQAIEEAYEQRLKDAALRAEAEKLILTQSQDELLSLLREYAPDYDATGQTLGEKLLDGFTQKVGGIAAWFEDFNSRMAQAQEHMAQLAQSAADSFYHERQQAQDAPQEHPGVTVNQSIAFNQPVDSPAQMARRMEQVNEELALLL